MNLPGPGLRALAGSYRSRDVQKKAELMEKWLAENQPKLGAAGREKTK